MGANQTTYYHPWRMATGNRRPSASRGGNPWVAGGAGSLDPRAMVGRTGYVNGHGVNHRGQPWWQPAILQVANSILNPA